MEGGYAEEVRLILRCEAAAFHWQQGRRQRRKAGGIGVEKEELGGCIIASHTEEKAQV